MLQKLIGSLAQCAQLLKVADPKNVLVHTSFKRTCVHITRIKKVKEHISTLCIAGTSAVYTNWPRSGATKAFRIMGEIRVGTTPSIWRQGGGSLPR